MLKSDFLSGSAHSRDVFEGRAWRCQAFCAGFLQKLECLLFLKVSNHLIMKIWLLYTYLLLLRSQISRFLFLEVERSID